MTESLEAFSSPTDAYLDWGLATGFRFFFPEQIKSSHRSANGEQLSAAQSSQASDKPLPEQEGFSPGNDSTFSGASTKPVDDRGANFLAANEVAAQTRLSRAESVLGLMDDDGVDPRAFVGLLIEWKSDDAAFRAWSLPTISALLPVPNIYIKSKNGKPQRFWALSAPRSSANALISAAGGLIKRIELAAAPLANTYSLPVSPSQIRQSDQAILAAVLDDGCAFANSQFLQAANTSRVLWLWNQDPDAAGFALDGSIGPSVKCNFGYGGQWSRSDLDSLIALTPGQESAYARAGLPGLRRAAAHGPHVMDLLAGGEDWPVVFIQFPQAGIDDPSGRWLTRYVLDGLHYILESAGPNTKTIVVNLSWGPQTEPHDGTGFLESAIDDLITWQKDFCGRELIVTLAAGNSYSARAHAQIDFPGGGSVQWVVPPDGHSPAFLEAWWPKGVKPEDVNLRLRVVPPNGVAQAIKMGNNPMSLS